MKKNELFEVAITDLSDEGAGIGRSGGLVWFIKDTLPGDQVEAAVMKMKKNYGFARLVRVLKPSPERTEPLCPIARQCGGCQLQAMDYAAQLRFKEEKVLNNLRRIGGFAIPEPVRTEAEQLSGGCAGKPAWGAETGSENETEKRTGADGENRAAEHPLVCVEPIIGMEEPFRYRNKAQYPISRNRDGKMIAGFYAGRTHSVIACTDCLLGCRENRRILDCIIGWMERYDLPPYDEESGKGLVRHVLIRKGYASAELMICLVINAGKLPREAELLRSLQALSFADTDPAARISSVSYSINRERTNVIMGTELVNLYGPGYIEDSIRRLKETETGWEPDEAGGAVTFRISPLSFYQVNLRQTERLYSTALAYADLSGNETVWDLYCGIGTISLFLAQRAKKVYGVEIIPQAIENARENARQNGITNAEFYVGKAEEVLPQWYAAQCGAAEKNTPEAGASNGAGQQQKVNAACEKIDVIVVDPPRKGCDEKCLETIVKIAPERVVYVSCDSATLARDLKYLCANGYAIRKVRACDMFAQTVHVETVVLLSHKKADSYIHVDVEFGEGEGKIPVDKIVQRAEKYKPKEKVTYKKIKEYIAEKYGFQVHTAYIAEVKRNLGLPMYDAPNAVAELKQPRKHPTPEKVEAIKDALRYFAVI